jgi:hypothetical protein
MLVRVGGDHGRFGGGKERVVDAAWVAGEWLVRVVGVFMWVSLSFFGFKLALYGSSQYLSM